MEIALNAKSNGGNGETSLIAVEKDEGSEKAWVDLLCTTARPPQERWSIRERINFKIALGRFGQDWPRVAQFVSTKTTDQISVYAEECFLKREHTGHSPVKNGPSPEKQFGLSTGVRAKHLQHLYAQATAIETRSTDPQHVSSQKLASF